MKPESALATVLEKLEEAGIAYMITGSYAGNRYGVPRTTYDADIVIEARQNSLDLFIRSIEKDFYVSPEAIQEARIYEGIFNAIHLETGLKIDLIIRKSRAFSRAEFNRRRLEPFLSSKYWFASPEDVILTKLEWAKTGESERQFRDALGIAQIQMENLDKDYLVFWANALNLQQELERLYKELK
jgi:hypothetical protein